MKQGALFYDAETDRIDIRFGVNEFYGGLHCGETLDVKVGGSWIPTRIEKAADWYLVGVKTRLLPDLVVRK